MDYPGNDIPGNDPIPNVPTAEACCDLCQQNPLCKLFTWSKNNKDCWLKHTEGLRVPEGQGIAGKPGNHLEEVGSQLEKRNMFYRQTSD